MEYVADILVFGGLLILFFTPWIIARHRNHHNALAIGMLNLFGGWTVIGWVVALVWACTSLAPRTVPQ